MNSRTECVSPGRKHEVVRLFVLDDLPHAFDVVPGVTPVAFGIQIAEIQNRLQSGIDARNGAGDLACDERLAAYRAFVVE